MRVVAFSVLSAVLATSVVTADFLWTSKNCPGSLGNVTDTLCCGPTTFCRKLVSEAACTSEVDDAALYCEWKKGQCQPVVDRQSNVCCRDQEVNSCAKMFAGQCPEQFEVARECCQGDAYTKYAFLKTSDPEKICCNAPCAAMEAANCTLPIQCGPTQRSYGLYNPPHSLGFFGYHNPAFDHHYGTIFYGTGYGHDYPPYRRRHRKHRRGKKGKKHHKKDRYDDHDHDDHHDDHDHYEDDYYKDYDHSKEDHVDEITVDDIFALMIDAMEKETDVKVYDADITSDPYLGKTWSGGLFVDHHFPDVEPIFDEIYRYPNYRPYYGGYPFGGYPYGGYGGSHGHPYGGYGGPHHGGQLHGGYGGPQQGGQQYGPLHQQGLHQPGYYPGSHLEGSSTADEGRTGSSFQEVPLPTSPQGGQFPAPQGNFVGSYPVDPHLSHQGGHYPGGPQSGLFHQGSTLNAGLQYPGAHQVEHPGQPHLQQHDQPYGH